MRKSEGRDPKAEGRNPKAGRRPNSQGVTARFSAAIDNAHLQHAPAFGLRILDFGLLSVFGFRPSGFTLVACVLLVLTTRLFASDSLFDQGLTAFRAGDYAKSADAFREEAMHQPASGTLQNLGLAEWHCGRTGRAVLAWEQALWLNPFNEAARANLRFVRKTAQLESPELAWYEVVSTWLPMNWWAWATTLSLWLAIGIGAVPGILHWRRAAWQQAVAALALTMFLLSLPAQLGLNTRSRLGFVERKDVPLRLTPTHEAQFVTRLSAGEPARLERSRGGYVLIRTSRSLGWVEREEFRLICAR